jgi:hypothetical protein
MPCTYKIIINPIALHACVVDYLTALTDYSWKGTDILSSTRVLLITFTALPCVSNMRSWAYVNLSADCCYTMSYNDGEQ